MSGDDCITFDDCVELDWEWLKKELQTLTNEERVTILSEYEAKVHKYGVGIKEYQRFVRLFDEMQEENDT